MSGPSYSARGANVSIGITAGLVKAAANRRSIAVQNAHASNFLYVGPDNTVTTSNGFRVDPGYTIAFNDYTGAVYAIASGASTDVRYLEVGP